MKVMLLACLLKVLNSVHIELMLFNSFLQVNNSAVLEICLPNEAVVIKRPLQENDLSSSPADILACGIQSVVLDPAPECVAKLLSLTVDHIDTLLEDW